MCNLFFKLFIGFWSKPKYNALCHNLFSDSSLCTPFPDCSNAMEFSPFWHPSHSVLPSLHNCIKDSPLQTISQQLTSNCVFFLLHPHLLPSSPLYSLCALARVRVCVRVRVRACASACVRARTRVCVVCKEYYIMLLRCFPSKFVPLVLKIKIIIL